MSKIFINLVVEDELHQNILYKILNDFSQKFEIGETYGLRGNGYIKKRLAAFNQASKHSNYLILTDLDDGDCPPTLINEWVQFKKDSNLIFRVAVREAESWILSDRENLASYLGVSRSVIERDSEGIRHPKEYVVKLAHRSRKRRIKEDLIPRGSATVGPNYNLRLSDFIHNFWDIQKAKANNKSLAKLIKSLENF